MTSTERVVLAALLTAGCLPSDARGQAHEPDPEAVEAFTKLVESYRERPALRVATTVNIQLRMGEIESQRREVTAEFTLGRGRTGIVTVQGFTCYVSDGKLTAVHETTDNAYFSSPDDGSPYYSLMNAFVDVPFPHLAIAFGEDAIDEVCMQLHQMAPWIQPTSVDTVTRDGENLGRIKLTSDFDDLTILYDRDTKLIELIELEVTGGSLVQDGATLVYKHTFDYETFDEPLPEATYRLAPGQRQRVDLLAALVARPQAAPDAAAGGGGALVGAEAPGFVLATVNGDAIDLEALRGTVVVLDFWATWCGPCRRALPLLHNVARWANEQDLPVTVVTVNAWERGGPDERLASAQKFWDRNGFTLPVAMDYTDKTAADYRVTAIPATIVIRADGMVHARHDGIPGDYVAALQHDITEAISALEGD